MRMWTAVVKKEMLEMSLRCDGIRGAASAARWVASRDCRCSDDGTGASVASSNQGRDPGSS